jgi:hypothetical protein
MGEEEREDLRDTLKLPVRLRRTLSFVIPAEPVLVETGSGNPVLGIAVNPHVDCRIGGTSKPSEKGKGATDHAPAAPLHALDGWRGQSETCP